MSESTLPWMKPCAHAEPQGASQLHGVCIFCYRDRLSAAHAQITKTDMNSTERDDELHWKLDREREYSSNLLRQLRAREATIAVMGDSLRKFEVAARKVMKWWRWEDENEREAFSELRTLLDAPPAEAQPQATATKCAYCGGDGGMYGDCAPCNGVGEVTTASEWQPLSEIPDGSIFETRDGIRAVKSEYRYSNEYPAIQCILLASGEYAHFAQHIKEPMPSACAHNSTLVRAISPSDVSSSSRAAQRNPEELEPEHSIDCDINDPMIHTKPCNCPSGTAARVIQVALGIDARGERLVTVEHMKALRSAVAAYDAARDGRR
jgi:hypothetical protein